MKTIAAIFTVLALFPSVSFASQEAGQTNPDMPAATVSGSMVYPVNGDVFVTQGKLAAHRLSHSEPIKSDTLIQTGDKGAALLRFEDGQVVTMQAKSIFYVREYRYNAKSIRNSSIVFSMFQGGMRFITGLIGQHDRQAFRLSTPDATIGIRGTDFMVTMVGKSLYSRVLNGKISLTNAAGMKMVSIGQTVVVPSTAVLASLVSPFAVPADTFDKLQFIPVDPSAIPAPVPEPMPVAPLPEPAPLAPAPEPAPASAVQPAPPAAGPAVMPGAPAAAAPAAAVAAPAAPGLAGAATANAGNNSGPDQTAAAASSNESAESAKAADANPMDRNSRSDVAMNLKIGSLGLGAELDLGLTDSLGARIGLNSFTYKYNANSSTVNYDFKLQLQTISALADWYPFQGSFRTSAGLMYNNNKVSLNGLPTGGTYDINGNTYSAAEVGSLQGSLSFNKVAPYIGIGWGNPAEKNKGWGMTSDIGVLFQGNPKTSLVATCGTAAPAGSAACTQLQSDTAAENTKLQSDLSNFKWWPVVSVGISYQW